MHQLSCLAAGLFEGTEIRVRAHAGGWAWHESSRTILVNEADIVTQGPEVSAGILAHEVGHCAISRYLLFRGILRVQAASRYLLNVLEDPRVEWFMIQRYPGTRAWLQAAYSSMNDEKVPLAPSFGSFCMASLWEYHHNWEQYPFALLPTVRTALQLTRSARRAYTELFLGAVGIVPGQDRTALYEQQVRPAEVDGTTAAGTGEEVIRRCLAHEALELARVHIAPYVEQLWLMDWLVVTEILSVDRTYQRELLDAAVKLNSGPFLAATLEPMYLERSGPGLLPHEPGAQVNAELFSTDLTPPQSNAVTALAETILIKIITSQTESSTTIQMAPEQAALFSRALEMSERGGQVLSTQRRVSPQGIEAYERAKKTIEAQRNKLMKQLEQNLHPTRAKTPTPGYRSGQRVDLKRVFLGEANPKVAEQVWSRHSTPDRRSVAVLLLVDLSGSMRNGKVENALCGTTLLVEVLCGLKIPFGVYGFQDVLIPFIEMGTHVGTKERAMVGEMPQEVHGDRQQGNNTPQFNDDGPCLLEAATILLRTRVTQRFLIVLSDGRPEGRRSTEQDLKQAIAQIQKMGIHLRALGLGPGTDHVSEYYAHSISNVPLEEFASAIASQITSIVLHQV